MARQRSPRVPIEEQVRLINECRRSGMTDVDWCKSQGIVPSTFYNWVKRCRKREAAKIQAPSYGHSDTPAPKQDVVSINIVPDVPEVLMAKQNHSPMSMNLDNSDKFMQTCVLEVKIQDFSIGIHNYADPMLLAQTLRILKELSCDISGLDNIYIVCGYTDMRKSIDGLCAVVETQLRMNPASSSLFLFCGRRRDRIKALFKDRDGYVLIYKRLSVEGGYQWPRKSSEARNLTWKEFDWLMSGIDIDQPKALKPEI